MRILVEQRAADLLVLRLDAPYTMADQATVDAFYNASFEVLGKTLQGRKAYILLDMSKITIGPGAAKYYGEWVKKFSATFAIAAIRFGVKDGMTKAAVLAQSIINHYTANVYVDLAAAEAVVAQLRGGNAKVAQGK